VCKFGDCSVINVRVRVNRMYGRNTKLYVSDESEGSGWTPEGVSSVRYPNELYMYIRDGVCVCVCVCVSRVHSPDNSPNLSTFIK